MVVDDSKLNYTGGGASTIAARESVPVTGDLTAAQNLIAVQRPKHRVVDGIDRRVSFGDTLTLVSMAGGTRADEDRGALDDVARAAARVDGAF